MLINNDKNTIYYNKKISIHIYGFPLGYKQPKLFLNAMPGACQEAA